MLVRLYIVENSEVVVVTDRLEMPFLPIPDMMIRTKKGQEFTVHAEHYRPCWDESEGLVWIEVREGDVVRITMAGQEGYCYGSQDKRRQMKAFEAHFTKDGLLPPAGAPIIHWQGKQLVSR